jgi:aryl-alcohol dehydrogenase-like predicted oxidoreductase
MGTMQFGWTADEAASLDVLDAAFEAGVNFIDTANIYSRWVDGNPGGVSETILGKWFARHPARRNLVVLATKVRGPMGAGPTDQGLSRKHIFQAVQASMERMKTSYIDLYQLHWPDEQTPIEETLSALTDTVKRGWVHHIGCSNFPAWKLVEALLLSDLNGYVRFVSLQPHYNLVHRGEYERELRAVCSRYGLGVMPYSPLARGFLTGKYSTDGPARPDRDSIPERIRGYLRDPGKQSVLKEVIDIAESKRCSPSQISLAWLLKKRSITSPIIGPRNVAQLKDNLGALEIELDEVEVGRLDSASAWER